VVGRSPCRRIRLPAAEVVDRPALDASQLAAVATGLGDHAAMVWLGAVLGLRWGEAAGLTVASLDFLRGDIAIARQLGRDRELADPKSAAGRRRIAAPAWLLDNLAALLVARRLTAADGAVLVFVNGSGGPLNYTAWRRIRWVPVSEAAGLPGLRIHDLRSAAAASAMADRRAANLVGEHFRPRDARGMEG